MNRVYTVFRNPFKVIQEYKRGKNDEINRKSFLFVICYYFNYCIFLLPQSPMDFSLLKVILTFSLFSYSEEIYDLDDKILRLGDINIGVITQVMDYSRKLKCTNKISRLSSLQYAQTIIYAIDKINERKDLLPNLNLGYIIYPDCGRKDTSLAAVTKFIEARDVGIRNFPNKNNITITSKYTVPGVIGLTTSTKAIPSSALLSYYEIPHISTSATSSELNDKFRYEYFSRILPGDTTQAYVMVDLIQAYDWNYVSVVWQVTVGYQMVMTDLLAKLNEVGICVASQNAIYNNSTERDIENIAETLLDNSKAKAVILWMYSSTTKRLFNALEKKNSLHKFIWISTGVIDNVYHFYPNALTTGLFRVGVSLNISEDLKDFLSKRSPFSSNGTDLRWMKLFWEQNFKCSWNNRRNSCEKYRYLPKTARYSVSTYSATYFDSILSMVYAINATINRYCPILFSKSLSASNLAKHSHCLAGKRILKAIRNLDFFGMMGRIRFDNHGNIIKPFLVEQIISTNQSRTLAIWQKDTGFQQINPLPSIPSSRCSSKCPPGFKPVPSYKVCCWYCSECSPNQITINNGTDCQTCPDSTWPDLKNRTSCLQLKKIYLQITDPIIITIMIVTGFLIVSCVLLIYLLFLRFSDTQVVKNSSKELCFIIIIGILISLSTNFILLIKPSNTVCICSIIGFHLGVNLTFVPLMMKSQRMFSLFRAASKCSTRAIGVQRKWQLTAVLILSILQVRLRMIIIIPNYINA